MECATKKLAQAIASVLGDNDKRSHVEQMAVYFAIGRALQKMVEDQATYGSTAIVDTVKRVPQLLDENHCYRIMSLSSVGPAVKKLILSENAIPMDNGQPLTLRHWLWVLRHQPWGGRRERKEWLLCELAWLREESPSAAVLEHIEAVLEERHSRELEVAQEKVREAIGLLESV
jgi:hypothetical protein